MALRKGLLYSIDSLSLYIYIKTFRNFINTRFRAFAVDFHFAFSAWKGPHARAFPFSTVQFRIYLRITWEITRNYSRANKGNDSPYFVRSPIIEEATRLLLHSSFLTLISRHVYFARIQFIYFLYFILRHIIRIIQFTCSCMFSVESPLEYIHKTGAFFYTRAFSASLFSKNTFTGLHMVIYGHEILFFARFHHQIPIIKDTWK